MQHPEAAVDGLASLKDFVRTVAYGIDGDEGNEIPCSETVRKYWNTFTAAWQREPPDNAILQETAQSVTQVQRLNHPKRLDSRLTLYSVCSGPVGRRDGNATVQAQETISNQSRTVLHREAAVRRRLDGVLA
jgi:hypothetical protein